MSLLGARACARLRSCRERDGEGETRRRAIEMFELENAVGGSHVLQEKCLPSIKQAAFRLNKREIAHSESGRINRVARQVHRVAIS